MRLSNRSKVNLYNFMGTSFLMLFVLGIIGFFVERYRFKIFSWETYLFIIVPVVLLMIFYARGRQIFEYDSDGEALNFKNRNVFPMLDKSLNDEFPKYKLKKFEIFDAFFYKKLYITISSKKSHSLILKYDVSYLTGKELKDLRFSLNKVVKNNEENKREEE